MRRRVALFCLAATCCALAACQAPPDASEREAAGAWQRQDLWLEKPVVEVTPFPGGKRPTYRRFIGYLGAQEVRDLSRVPPQTLATYPHQAAGQVRSIEQITGSRLAWPVELGREPHLSLRPLLDEQAPCPCTFRVGVRAGGEIVELLRLEGFEPPPPGPLLRDIDLSQWAGRTVEVLLQVDGPAAQPGRPAPHVRWASPAVYSRMARREVGAPAEKDRPPNIVLIGADTLRADHVAPFRPAGAPPQVSLTPGIDRLAAESDVWTRAYSTFNVTNPSFASILTGLYGKNHGVYDLKTPLPPAHDTLAERLQEAGYDTLAVIAARHLGDHNSGLGQGFDEVVRSDEHYAAELGVEMTVDWITQRQAPFFVWLHLFDPHTPHTPPRPYDYGMRPATATGLAPVDGWTAFRSLGERGFEQAVLAGHRDLYAGEVAYLDRQIDRLVSYLDSHGLLENTVVAFTADHGENLGEHGILHRHIGLWETTTHVPLLVRWPGARREGRRFDGLVQTLDLFPTLLAAAGLEVPEQDGVDLRQLTGDGRRGRRAVFSEHASQLGVSVRSEGFRYVLSSGNPHIPDGPHLYDLTADPGETRDLAGTGHPQEAALDDLLRRWLRDRREAPEARTRELSQEEIDRLKSLGYL